MRLREEFKQGEITAVAGASMPRVERLVRHSNSGWTFHFKMEGEAELPDGRRVLINRTVAVRATEQIGRKGGA